MLQPLIYDPLFHETFSARNVSSAQCPLRNRNPSIIQSENPRRDCPSPDTIPPSFVDRWRTDVRRERHVRETSRSRKKSRAEIWPREMRREKNCRSGVIFEVGENSSLTGWVHAAWKNDIEITGNILARIASIRPTRNTANSNLR